MTTISELAALYIEHRQQLGENVQYGVMMHADMFYFLRAHSRSAAFWSSRRWLRQNELVSRVKIHNFVRTLEPVYHEAETKK